MLRSVSSAQPITYYTNMPVFTEPTAGQSTSVVAVPVFQRIEPVYLSHRDASGYIRRQGFRTKEEYITWWTVQHLTNLQEDPGTVFNFPDDPEVEYGEGHGWVSWDYWLGITDL